MEQIQKAKQVNFLSSTLAHVGGAENVLKNLHREFQGNIYSAIFAPEICNSYFRENKDKIKSISENIDEDLILKSYAGYASVISTKKLMRWLKKIEFADEFIMPTDIIATLADVPDPKIAYVHATYRSFTDLRKFYTKDLSWKNKIIHCIMAKSLNRKISKKLKNYKKILVNSYWTKNLMKNYYGVNCDVVYPPVDTEFFTPAKTIKKGKYFLSVQRISKEKRIHLQVRAFATIPNEKLVIVGAVQDWAIYEYIKSLKLPNVEFFLNPTQEELRELYRGCKATIMTSIREEFGLVPLEGMACGRPAIVINDGGFKETVNKNVGIRLNEPIVPNLIKAVENLEAKNYDPNELRKYAEKFKSSIFLEKIRNHIWEVM